MPVLNLEHYSQDNEVPNTAWALPVQAVLSKSTANLKKKLKDGAYVGKTRSTIKKRKSSLQITDEQSRMQRVHERCCHRDMKQIMRLKALGRLVAKDLPPKFLRAHRKACPICLAMKRRKSPTPESRLYGSAYSSIQRAATSLVSSV